MIRTPHLPAPSFAALALVVFGTWMVVALVQPLGLILGGLCFLTGVALLLLQGLLHFGSEARVKSDLELENRSLKDLSRKEDHLRQGILANLREGVVLLGPQKEVRLYNPAAQGLLGTSSRLALGASLPGVFREPESLRHIELAYSGAETEWTLHRDPRVLRLRAVPFELVDSEQKVLLTLDDITRQEALETTRQKFISNASHELKTPVTSIRIATENLTDGGFVAAGGESSVKAILRSVDRMTMLLDDISELSRIETGALRLEARSFPLGAFLPQLLEDLRHQAGPRHIALTTELEPGLEDLLVEADPLRLHQLLENLLSNAIKFSPEGSGVVLRIQNREPWLIWSVQDSGPGISESDAKRIFERFYRAPSTRGIPGTGLGLAIVKHLTLLMGGEVSLQSELGKGSTFTVKLPLKG
ncbi:MAG: PAS domain-containing protein [Acidobacteriota bacterium]|nr:PAS domain-containing protein [Acidobacteriota bacterium]